MVVVLLLPFFCCIVSERIFGFLSQVMDLAAASSPPAAKGPVPSATFFIALFAFFCVVMLVQRWHTRGASPRLVAETKLLLCRSQRLACFSRSPRIPRLLGETMTSPYEVTLRRAFWVKQLSHMPRGTRAKIAHSTTPLLMPMCMLAMIVYPIAMYFRVPALGWISPFAPMLFFWGATMIPIYLGHRRLKRLREALDRPLCPDCGYNLEGLPESKDRCGRPAPGMGPHCCPECGTPWPMIPPAVPKSPES